MLELQEYRVRSLYAYNGEGADDLCAFYFSYGNHFPYATLF